MITTLSNIICVSAGCEHSIFVSQNGKCFAAGGRAHGKCGDGKFHGFSTPSNHIDALTNIHIGMASCGYSHTVFLEDNYPMITFSQYLKSIRICDVNFIFVK